MNKNQFKTKEQEQATISSLPAMLDCASKALQAGISFRIQDLQSIDKNIAIWYYLYTLTYTNMDNINPQDKKEMIRVSISEAARLFGVNPQTIRRAIKAGEITYVVVAGRYKINFESLVKWSQAKTTVKKKSEQRGIGQYVDKWKIKNTLYSPSPKSVKKEDEPEEKKENDKTA